VAGMSGSSDGTGSAASFSYPTGVAVDGTGNLYVVDHNNGLLLIRKITPAGVVSTLALDAPVSAYSPTGVALDPSGNIYVTDTFYDTIHMITPAGMVTTVAGLIGVQGTLLGPLPTSINTPSWLAFNPVSGALVVTARNAVLQLK